MDDSLHDMPEPPRLKFLRRLVTVLTLSLIGMVITIAVLFVLKFQEIKVGGAPMLPESITLPDGESAEAITMGSGWSGVVTRDASGVERIRIFGPDGVETQVVEIE
ncbi:DUF6476 family protein [Paracoccaceae bacterium GXU_MW_L88]